MYKSLAIYFQSSLLRVCLFGFINGMNFLLSGNTLNFWLADFEIDTRVIGFFSLITLPYALKYFIAIFIDKHQIPILCKIGPYKAWLIFSQISLIISLASMGFLNPTQDLWMIAILGFFISLFSVIQNVIFHGKRIQTLETFEQGPGAAIYSIGHRFGMFLTGAGVIFASAYISWFHIYITLAILYSIFLILIFYSYNEQNTTTHNLWFNKEKTLFHNIFINPIKHFLGYKNFIWIILFIMLYQLPESMFIIMLNPFLLQGGYSAEEIASVAKIFGITMAIIGGATSGPLLHKFDIKTCLLSFGLLHIFGHALFIFLAYFDKNILALGFIIGYMSFTGGMATTAYIAFISGLSRGKYVTTLYALLASAIGMSRVLFPAFSGIIVDSQGWINFFIIITILGFLSLAFTWLVPNRIYQIHRNSDN